MPNGKTAFTLAFNMLGTTLLQMDRPAEAIPYLYVAAFRPGRITWPSTILQSAMTGRIPQQAFWASCLGAEYFEGLSQQGIRSHCMQIGTFLRRNPFMIATDVMAGEHPTNVFEDGFIIARK